MLIYKTGNFVYHNSRCTLIVHVSIKLFHYKKGNFFYSIVISLSTYKYNEQIFIKVNIIQLSNYIVEEKKTRHTNSFLAQLPHNQDTTVRPIDSTKNCHSIIVKIQFLFYLRCLKNFSNCCRLDATFFEYFITFTILLLYYSSVLFFY